MSTPEGHHSSHLFMCVCLSNARRVAAASGLPGRDVRPRVVRQGGNGHAGGGETLQAEQDLLFSSSSLSLSCCVFLVQFSWFSVFLDVTCFLFLNCLRFLKEMIEKEMDNNLEVKIRAGELG